MKIFLVLAAIMLGLTFSCAALPTGPLSPGEVRLLEIDIPDYKTVGRKSHFNVVLRFEADKEAYIESACFSWIGGAPRCFKPKVVGSGPHWEVHQSLLAQETGTYILTAYLLYHRDGKTVKSNELNAPVTVGKRTKI